MASKNIKIYLALLFAVLVPASVLAADNVTLAMNVIINTAGINLTVTGHTSVLDTLTINSDNFSVVLDAGRELKITSSDRRTFTVPATGSLQVSTTCDSAESTLTLTNPSGSSGQVTATVTPSSGTCTFAGGGIIVGGGAVSAPVIAPENFSSAAPSAAAQLSSAPPSSVPPVSVPAAQVAQPSVVALAVSPVFNSTLRLGSRSADVKRLQQILNFDPDTKLTDSGLGSPGNETEFFGALTRAAVRAFQKKHGIVSSGDESTTGFGLVGPKTRAKLADEFGGSKPPALAAPSGITTEDAQVKSLQTQIQSLLEKVKLLQEQLKAL